ncbi:MAG TPA: hypothetical protein VE690_16675 [Rhodopila sp.]|nr:hypothetical protein [Rhodopila sp.]
MKETREGWLDRVINAGMIVLVSGSIGVALTVGAAVPAGGMQAVMPASEWRPLFDQGVFHASRHEARLFSTANAPVGQGWG